MASPISLLTDKTLLSERVRWKLRQGIPVWAMVMAAFATAVGEEPVRGTIYDRNGVPLAVDDRADVRLTFDLGAVEEAYREANDGRIAKRKFEYVEKGKRKEKMETDMVTMFQAVIMPDLEVAGLVRPLDTVALSVHYRTYRETRPFELAKELGPEDRAKMEALHGVIPGMAIRVVKLRRYPLGAGACHLLGYVNVAQIGDDPDVTHGVYGAEKAFEDRLAVKPALGDKPARSGADVYLTIDVRHQCIVERAFRECIPTIGRGAAVLLDVNTGDVLAMVAVPSCDLNDFIPAISREKFETLNKDPTHPLLNRTVRSFVPGSTFTVVTSLAGISAGLQDERWSCAGQHVLGGKTMTCWIGPKGGAHGTLGFQEAFAVNCGPWFHRMGIAVGAERLATMAELLSLGRAVGRVGLPEETKGIIPGPAWWAQNRPSAPYTEATTANFALGQGAVECTPLQLASVMATVANGGTVWQPRLLDRVLSGGDGMKEEKQPPVRLADLREHGVTEAGLAPLRQGLRDTVVNLAIGADSPNIAIAGRTGTAQNWRTENGEAVMDNHTWFISYAPMEKPRWALAVIVQGAKSGGSAAAPIAARIFEQLAELEAGRLKVEVGAMAPVQGNFKPVEAVEYPAAGGK